MNDNNRYYGLHPDQQYDSIIYFNDQIYRNNWHNPLNYNVFPHGYNYPPSHGMYPMNQQYFYPPGFQQAEQSLQNNVGSTPPFQGTPVQNNPMFNQPSRPPVNSLMTYFQDKNGQLDLDKMLTTFGKLSTTVQQVSPLFKQLGSFFTKLR